MEWVIKLEVVDTKARKNKKKAKVYSFNQAIWHGVVGAVWEPLYYEMLEAIESYKAKKLLNSQLNTKKKL